MQICWEVLGNFIPKLLNCDRKVEVIFFEYFYLNLVPLCKNISPKKELKNLNAFLHFNVP